MTRTRDLAPASQPAPRRRWSLVGVGLLLAAVTGVTGCGQQTPDSATAGTSVAGAADAAEGVGGAGDAPEAPRVARLTTGEAGPELTCATDERAGMIADFAPNAKGADTPEKALAREDLEDGESLLLNARGSKAWILRGDGTARAEIGLREVRGWVVSDRMSCA